MTNRTIRLMCGCAAAAIVAPATAQTGNEPPSSVTAPVAGGEAASARSPAATGPETDSTSPASFGTAQLEVPTDAAGGIVVTAQKRSERLQDVPIAVSVVSGAALTQSGKPAIEAAVNLVPALNFQKSGTTLNQSLFLRGVGTTTFSIAGEPSVSTVVDGVVFSRAGEAFGDLNDIARLEVLRGPQGTLFGKNASAGVINIVTVQPGKEFGGYVEGQYFSRGTEARVRGAVDVPVTDNLLTRIVGFYGHYDGNIRNVAYDRRVNGYKHYGARGQVNWAPTPTTTIALIGDYHRNDDDCCAEVIGTGPLNAAGAPITSPAFAVLPTPRGDKTRAINQNFITRTKETGWGVSAQIDQEAGTQTVTSITAYRSYKNTELRDGDFLPRAYVGFPQIQDRGPQTGHTFSQEIRLTSPTRQFLSYVLGFYYSRAESERVFSRAVVSCGTAAPATLIPCGGAGAPATTTPFGIADFGSVFKNIAVFGQGTANFTSRFRFIGGIRWTADQLNVFESRTTTLAGPGVQPSFPVTPTGTGTPAGQFKGKTTNTNVSGRAVLQYDVTPHIVAYGGYTRGYKGPAFNVFFNLTATGTNVIAAETSNAFEIGLKNTFFGGLLTLNLDAFYAKYDNFQANNPDLVAGVVVTRFTNAGKVSTRGGEADFIVRPMPDLTFSGGIAYTDAHVDRFFQAVGAPATAVIPSGTSLPFAPKWKGSVSGDYRWRTGGPIDLFLGAQGNYQSKQLALFSPDAVQRRFGTIHQYGLVNLSAGIGDRDDRYKLTFEVRNLLDQSFAAAIQNGGPSGSYRYQIPRDANRYFGVTGRATF